MRLIGFDAIDYAERTGMVLNHPSGCAHDGYRISISEAEGIAMEAPERIWLIVPDEDMVSEVR